MGIFANIYEGIRNLRFRVTSGVNQQPLWWSPPTAAGIDINETTALNQSTVFTATSVIAGTAASLPLVTYQRLPNGGKRRAPEHQNYYILHDEPNNECSALQFREALLAHVLLWGNGYAEIVRDGAGRPVELWLLSPSQVRPYYTKRNELRYEVTSNGKPKTLWPEDIVHVAGLGFDGVIGYSVISLARESIALTAATERFGASFFGNNASPSGVFSHPQRLKPAAEATWRKNILDQISKPGAPLFLDSEASYQPYTIPPEQAQYLGTRLFQLAEVARWFKVHPYFLGDLSHSTFSNGEQAMLHFVVHTIRPLCVRLESEFNRKLFSFAERQEYFCEHLIDGLLRGDTMTRYSAYNIGRNGGWLSVNDIRNTEGMNPVDGGDVYLLPLNMTSAAPTPEPTPTPTEPASDEPKPKPVDAAEQLASAAASIQEAQVKAIALDAVQGTVIDAYGRMARREAAAIRRASKKGNLVEWADEFYADHRTLLVESLGPSVRAWLTVSGSARSANDVTTAIADKITREHRQVVVDGFADIEDFATSLEASTEEMMLMLSEFAEHPESLPSLA